MKDDGGPAFPIPNVTDMDGYVFAPEARGMTMRQYYKAAIVQGIFGAHVLTNPANWWSVENADALAEYAAKFADAMIAEDRAHAEKNDD